MFSLPAGSRVFVYPSLPQALEGVFALFNGAWWRNKLLNFHLSDRKSLSSAIKERWQVKAQHSYNNRMLHEFGNKNNYTTGR